VGQIAPPAASYEPPKAPRTALAARRITRGARLRATRLAARETPWPNRLARRLAPWRKRSIKLFTKHLHA